MIKQILLAMSAVAVTGMPANGSDNLEQFLVTGICDGCDLRGANLAGKHVTVNKLQNADLRGSDWSNAVIITPDDVSITHNDFTGAKLNGLELYAADFSNNNVQRATLVGAHLNLTNTFVQNTFVDATLSNASITARVCYATSFDSSRLDNARLEFTQMMRFCNMTKVQAANLALKATAVATTFDQVDLHGAVLTLLPTTTGILFTDSDLRQAIIPRVSATAPGVSFTNGTQLGGMRYLGRLCADGAVDVCVL